jgi:hypothetical protein
LKKGKVVILQQAKYKSNKKVYEKTISYLYRIVVSSNNYDCPKEGRPAYWLQQRERYSVGQ